MIDIWILLRVCNLNKISAHGLTNFGPKYAKQIEFDLWKLIFDQTGAEIQILLQSSYVLTETCALLLFRVI